FSFFDNSIEVTLPCMISGNNLSEEQASVYAVLQNKTLSSSEIMTQVGFSKNKTLRILNELIEAGYAEKIGKGRGTKYRAS
ncbi:MAG: helix-turn-helix domain-containing protein, partial [Prevotellaceae bacterium]|nr:helix-turn-helix domain-containing protein [Prevotellaceae bacterium]